MSFSDAYTIVDKVYEGETTVVYRALGRLDHVPVLLKTLAPRRARPKDVERLRTEYELGKDLDARSAIRAVAFDSYEGVPALLLPDFGGRPLDRSLGAPMEVGRFLDLAIGIARDVEDIHERGILHKDLKPQNIFVSEGGEVKIADFGHASHFCSEQPAAQAPEIIEGTLAYMAPEQTGRMNRGVDRRADLYSIGITYYEMLTGVLPFRATDPVEWIHCHVACAVPSLAEHAPHVPEMVRDIVAKLLAKMPEDRYQTARGLRYDLERCRAAFRSSGAVAPFRLAERDVPDRLQIPQKLYGRDQPAAELRRAFDRVVDTGASELVLVSGDSGVGKSSLVFELRGPVLENRGFFGAGTFDPRAHGTPYATFSQAFQQVVLQILAENQNQIGELKRALLEGLGESGRLIVEVIPHLAAIIGEQPEVASLPPTEARNRFQLVFRKFVAALAQARHPVVLFLDDLQWADGASLVLLRELSTDPDVRFLLVVGAYRDNQVAPSHPLIAALDEARTDGARISHLPLRPLSPEQLAEFVGDALRRPVSEVRALADLIFDRTGGSPFFVIHFLVSLYEERLVAFDADTLIWHWDLPRIVAKDLTDNVIELMSTRLRRLSSETRRALGRVACLASPADLELLTAILEGSESDVHAALSETVAAGLMVRQNGTYKFLHARIREAAYSLVDEEQRPSMHLRLGRLLLTRLPADRVQARVFDVLAQLNRGVRLLTDSAEKKKVLELDLVAGRKARAAVAYDAAQTYFAAAMQLLEPDAWRDRYEETVSLFLDAAECEYLVGNLQRAEDLCDVVLENARTVLDQARVHELRVSLYSLYGRYADALDAALLGLSLFGVDFPRSDEELRARTESELRDVSISLGGRDPSELVDAPIVTDPSQRMVGALLGEAITRSYIAKPQLLLPVVLRGVNLSLRYGNTTGSCQVYVSYGMALVSLLGDVAVGFRFSELGLRINRKVDDRHVWGRLLYLHAAYVNFWRRHFSTSLALLEQAFRNCLEAGDLVYAGFACFDWTWHAMETGAPVEHVLEGSRPYLEFAKRTRNEAVYHGVRLEQILLTLLQRTDRIPRSARDIVHEADETLAAYVHALSGVSLSFYYVIMQMATFLFGFYREALEFADQVAARLPGPGTSQAPEAATRFYLALTLAALHDGAQGPEQRDLSRRLETEVQKLETWAKHGPENFANRHALASAELARIQGRDSEAQQGYERAIRSARENGFVQNEGLAYELAAHFYETRGYDVFADAYLGEARSCYRRWGAEGKVRQLEQRHPQLTERRRSAATSTFAARTEQIDLFSVIKASQAISSEMVIDQLVRTLVKTAVEQSAAQKGCLVLLENEELVVAASCVQQGGGAVADIVSPVPIASASIAPASVVRYARMTKERVIVDDATKQPKRFASDDYFARESPRSFLCLPILKQGQVLGLLYLENDVVAGAFTPDRLTALELLASQAAISMENAWLLSREREARDAAERAAGREQAARTIAEEAVRLRDEFLSTASHELRTPVTSIQLVIQSLMRGLREGKPSVPLDMLSVASRQSDRLVALINQLLDVARIESGRLELELEEFDLAADAARIVERLQPEMTRTGSPIRIHASEAIVGRWDRLRIDQLLTNLLTNALAYGAGQPIDLTLEPSPAGDRVRMIVLDRGIGIPRNRLNRIFERFERATSVRHHGGLGLGLYIARQIAEAHGGWISVESEPGRGSSFLVELPLGAGKRDR